MRVERILLLLCCLLGAQVADAEIERVELSFAPDGAVRMVVKQDESLHARAIITHRDGGFLRGAWEIARPPSTLANPVYQPLELIQELLGGSGQLELASPVLPTEQVGAYLLRLRLDDFGNRMRIKPLRYQVVAP